MRMKIYKYVRLRDDWVKERSGGEKALAEKGGERGKVGERREEEKV